MGRYVYDASLVSQAIDELNGAISLLADVTTEIQAGVNTINSARGSNYIDVDYSELLKMQEKAETVIEEDIRTIQEKSTIIEDYENAPWYKKLFNSAGMALSKFVEGIASGIEDIGDGVVSIVGFVGGIFNSEFKNSVAEYVAKDHVGDWFQDQYDDGFLSGVSKYSWFSENSTAANLFKGFGSAVPYVALSMTGVGLTTEVIAAGLGGIGSGTEAGIQKALMSDTTGTMKAGDAFNSAFGQGLWQGTKNAVLVYGMGKLAKGIQANAAGKSGVITGMTDDFAKLTSGNMDDVATYAKKLFGSTDDLVAQSVNGKIQIHNAKTLEVVGDVVSDGSKAVIRNFGNASSLKPGTLVFSNKGSMIGYDMLKNTDDILATSFDDLAKASTVTKAEKAFQNAGEVKNTKLGKALQASDDALAKAGSKIANSKVGQKVGGVIDDVAHSKVVSKVTNTVANSKLAKAATNFVAKHPVATYGAAATVFTADQIDEQVVGSKYRLANEALDAATFTPADINPDPAVDPTGSSNGGNNNTTTPNGNNTTTPPSGNNSTTTPSGNNSTTTPPSGNNSTITVTDPGNNSDTISDVNTGDNNTSPDTNTGNNNVITTPNTNTENNNTNSNDNQNQNQGSNQNSGGGNNGYTGGYSNGGGYSSGGGYSEEGFNSETLEEEVELPGGETVSGSFAELIGGSKSTNIPTSAAPITTTTTTQPKKSVIPVIAGLSAAAVAGIGTKAYLDKKENNESEENFEAEEWVEEDSLDIDYNEAMEEDGDYLNPSDEYAYQEGEEDPSGSYEAVNSSELASMQ